MSGVKTEMTGTMLTWMQDRGADGLIVLKIGRQRPTERGFAEDDQMIEAFPANGPDFVLCINPINQILLCGMLMIP